MGLFMSMAGAVGTCKADVETALKEYAAARVGRFEPTTNTISFEEVLTIGEADGNTTVVYPSKFLGWDEAAAYLSRSLDIPVFSFHIHDGDLWMYILFVAGEVVDQFNPIPDYWDDGLSDEERRHWMGSSAVIARCCRQVEENAIRDYLVPWNLADDALGKSYEDDEFACGDCWQLMDFMRKLKLPYPFAQDGQPTGSTYVFEIKRKR